MYVASMFVCVCGGGGGKGAALVQVAKANFRQFCTD